MSQVKDKLKLLGKLVGNWNTTGKVLKTQTSPEIQVSGSDSYAWLPGEFFLLHIVDVMIGEDRNQTYEIIGYDNTGDYFTMHYFDNKGNTGFMKATIRNNQWTFLGDNLRFTGGFSDDENIFSGVWEQLDSAGNWQQFMDIHLAK